MTMNKILLAGACAALLAFSAAPGLAAGPMMSATDDRVVAGDAVQKVDRRDRWRGREWNHHSRRHFHGHRHHWRNHHYHSPRYGHRYWGSRGNRHYYSPRYGYWGSPYRPYNSYWRW